MIGRLKISVRNLPKQLLVGDVVEHPMKSIRHLLRNVVVVPDEAAGVASSFTGEHEASCLKCCH